MGITDELSIPDSELIFVASRSGGPGGQNVNKVSSRVTLLFDVAKSPSLTRWQRSRISERLAARINSKGILRVTSQTTRSQDMNRVDATERFADLLRNALVVERKRIKTRVTTGSRERRLERKRQRSTVKRQRQIRDND